MKIPPPLYVVTGLWHGKKREAISLPCSRLKAVELRDWTRRINRVFYILPDNHYICNRK